MQKIKERRLKKAWLQADAYEDSQDFARLTPVGRIGLSEPRKKILEVGRALR